MFMSGGGAASYTANGRPSQDGGGPGGASGGNTINLKGVDPSDQFFYTYDSNYGLGGGCDVDTGAKLGQNGGVRIIWGRDRFFPNSALSDLKV